jgi:hypothetical protein
MNWKAAGFAIAVGGAALPGTGAKLHAQRCQGCTPEDTTAHIHVAPALGLRFGEPQKASAAVGLLVGVDWQRDHRDHSRNAAVFVEPGVSAGRASIAYVDHGYGSFGSGFGVAATALRTWDDPWVAKQNATYVGGEVILWPIVFIGPRVGLFRSVAGDVGSKKWFFSIDFGIGL